MIQWNHAVIVYREGTTEGTYGSSVALAPLPVVSGLNAFPDQNWSGTQQNAGGEMQGAKRRWFLRSDVDVKERDVLRVTTGPESPSTIRVVSVFPVQGPRGTHHLEANVETFIGTLPEPTP